jgi:hypothetical protein
MSVGTLVVIILILLLLGAFHPGQRRVTPAGLPDLAAAENHGIGPRGR